MNMQLVHDWIAKRDAKDAMEAALKTLTAECETIEKAVLAEFEKEGMSQVKAGPRKDTVYLNRRVWARAIDAEGLCRSMSHYPALRGMVKKNVHPSTLSAWVKGEQEEGRALPAGIAKCISVVEEFTLKLLRGANQKESSNGTCHEDANTGIAD